MLKRLLVFAVLACTACGAAPQLAAETTCDVHVDAPAALQERLNDAGPNAVVCLSGTFDTTSTVRPLSGQTLVGGRLLYTGSYNVCRTCYPNMVDGVDLGAGNVTLQGIEVGGFEGLGVQCGPGTRVFNSYLHDNRRNGIGCIANGGSWHVQITGNRIERNGSPVLEGQASAGIKLMEISRPAQSVGVGAVIRDNVVLNNIGNGVWLDRSSNSSLIEGNTVYGNTHSGIRCEKCGGPVVIRDNVSHDNHLDGVAVVNSAVVALANNRTYGNGGVGIRVGYTTTGVATKTYPDLTPVTNGWRIKSIQVDDTRLASDRVVGCDLANVGCTA